MVTTIQYEICSSYEQRKPRKKTVVGASFDLEKNKTALFLASVVNQCDLVREATTSWGIDGQDDENAK